MELRFKKQISWMLWNALSRTSRLLPKVVEQAKKVSKDLLEWVDKGYQIITLTARLWLNAKI